MIIGWIITIEACLKEAQKEESVHPFIVVQGLQFEFIKSHYARYEQDYSAYESPAVSPQKRRVSCG